ncbi:MAG: hypothetical protein ACXVB0_14615 [Mucilaginibacter sp.]
MDIEIFTLLKEQVVEVFTFLLVVREFASGKGLQNDVEKINATIAENRYVLLLANNQLSDLRQPGINNRLGLFDVIKIA